MSELAKTGVYLGVAGVLGLMAYFTTPRVSETGTVTNVEELFPDFQDTTKAAKLSIAALDEKNGRLDEFQVARTDGKWTIPSRENYPADAVSQMAKAATAIIGLKSLDIVTQDARDHELYGVRDPSSPNVKAGDKGVGKLVKLEDESGNSLAALIIGKKDSKQFDLHYVRVPETDTVYLCKVDTSSLTTKFESWIEKDLLKLSSSAVREIEISDYSVDEVKGAIDMRGIISLRFEDKDQKWKLNELRVLNEAGELTPQEIAEDEELDTQKLNDQKFALDDLKIVNVVRKSPGLIESLTKGEVKIRDRRELDSLISHGFILTKSSAGAVSLYSNEGDVVCGTNDGVRYTLRFGELASDTGGANLDEAEGEKKKDEEDKPDEDEPEAPAPKNRYIFVMADFDRDLIPPPEYEAVPGADEKEGNDASSDADAPSEDSAEPAKDADGASDASKDEGTNEGKEAAEEPKDEEKAADSGATSDEPACADDESPAKEPAADGADESPAADETQPASEPETKAADADATSSDSKASDAKSSEAATPSEDPAAEPDVKSGDAPTAEPGAAEEGAAEPAVVDPAVEQAKEAAKKKADEENIERIKKANERKKTDYDKKVADGKKKVKDLNKRFSEWYYVISDETYKKIHLGRDQVIKKKEAKKDGLGGAQGDNILEDSDELLKKLQK